MMTSTRRHSRKRRTSSQEGGSGTLAATPVSMLAVAGLAAGVLAWQPAEPAPEPSEPAPQQPSEPSAPALEPGAEPSEPANEPVMPADPIDEPGNPDDAGSDAVEDGALTAPIAPVPREAEAEGAGENGEAIMGSKGRRLQNDEPTVLAFRNVTVNQVIPFIVESTGKVVLPQPDVLTRPITILNDQPIPRERALDLVFLALQQANVAVVETDDLIMLRDLAEIDRQDVPVLGPNESVLDRSDLGTIVEKVFQLNYGSAVTIGEMLKGLVPNFAKLNIDPDSNQIVVTGNIGLLQRIERLTGALDQPNAASLLTETFHLRYADATAVAQNIRDLFAQTGQQNQQTQAAAIARALQQRGNQGRNQPAASSTTASPSQNLRVTANTQQNAVTVLAEKTVLDQIRQQILEYWDKPLPEEAVIPRIYDLKNSDPLKVRDLLTGLFGRPTTGGQAASQQGVGRLAGQFTFEAISEKNQLVVVSKSPDNIAVIDKIIEEVDRPQTAGLPRIVELKHASAEELSEQLNALLAQESTLASIPRQETGLSDSSSTVSPFATGTTTGAQQQTAAAAAAANIQFWWQRAPRPTNTAGASNLVAKIRIVPVWRQNALMILSPPEYAQSVVSLIEQLDKPGRQVLLAAVIAEIGVEDFNALGLRYSSSSIPLTNTENAFQLGAGVGENQETFSGQKNNLLPGLFDTSVLDVGVNLNVVLQALAQKTDVNIISEPRIFTSDNQEAEFFSGQDIPFITDSQTTDQGGLTQTFDYRAVGISLRARPRITVQKDVDLRINLELSSIQPNQTLFGGFIVDRRETTTHLIVRDGQTVVVSGILRSEDSDVVRKVPILGDIPILGGLFKSTEKTKSKTELVAFVTPIVIENPEDAGPATRADQDRLIELKRQLTPGEATPSERVVPPDGAELPAQRPEVAPDAVEVQPAPNDRPWESPQENQERRRQRERTWD